MATTDINVRGRSASYCSRAEKKGRQNTFKISKTAASVATFMALYLSQSNPVMAQSLVVAGGIPWRLSTGLNLGETYSDNINLAPSGQEQSAFVTTISPTVRVQRKGPQLDLNVNYAPEMLIYSNSTNGNNLRNSLSGTAKAELWKEHVFVDASAQIGQQSLSPFGPQFGSQLADSVNGSSNRVETRTFSISPYITSQLWREVTYRLGYQYSHNSSDSGLYAASDSSQWTAALNGAIARDWQWALNYSRSQSQYQQFSDYTLQSMSATLTYLYDSRLSFNAQVGRDRNSYPAFAGDQADGASYSAGFDWRPSPTTNVNAQYGHRYFGRTSQFQLSRRTSWSIWKVAYTNDQTSSGQLLSTPSSTSNAALLDTLFLTQYPDPVQRAVAVNQYLQQNQLSNNLNNQSALLSNQLFVQKKLDLSVVLLGRINTVTLGYNLSEQTALTNQAISTDVFAANSRYRQKALTASWSYRLGPRTSLLGSAQRQRSEAVAGSGESTSRSFSASVQRQLQRKLSAALTLRHSQQTSSGVSPSILNSFSTATGSYSENSLIGTLSLQF